MIVSKEQQEQILIAAKEREVMYGSASKFAKFLDINPSVWSRLKNGDQGNLLSPGKWRSMARKLDINVSKRKQWKTAQTPIFRFISAQLEACQENGLSSMLCDMSDIGKTYTAEVYAASHKNVCYVDCSQSQSKLKLLRSIANGFGIGGNGSYDDLFGDVVEYIKAMETPLVILDEAGDLSHSAFKSIKALWNAAHHYCAFYMMGADGLEALVKRSIEYKRVGYTEIFSRFGKRYGSVFRADNYEGNKALQTRMTDKRAILEETAAMIIKANGPDDINVNNVLRRTMGDDRHPSLRRIEVELSKA